MIVRPLIRLLVLLGTVGAFAAAPADAARFTAVAAGTDNTCAIRSGGPVSCWGAGNFGQLGVIGATNRSRTPLAVIGTYTALQLAAGQTYWCALLANRTVTCTGNGARGQIGNGSIGMAQFPQPVSGLVNASRIAAGTRTACAVTGGKVVCWGDDSSGQLGDGQLNPAPNPSAVTVAGVEGAIDVAVGDTHACAIVSGGQVLCWGATLDGRLGTPNQAPLAFAGEPVTGLTGATAIATGNRHTCALRSDGTVWCWGRSDLGQLGAGPGVPGSSAPVQVQGLTGVTDISSLASTTCALRGDGTVWCWGDGLRGQLGNGAKVPSAVPVQVSGLKGATTVSAGLVHSCATTNDDGQTYCWGSNQYGQLGSGGTVGAAAREATPQLVEDSPKGLASFVPTPLSEQSKTSRGGYLDLRLYQVRRRGSRCPTTAEVTLRARGEEAVRKATDVEAVPGGCAVTGKFLLPPKTSRAFTVVYLIRGTHLRTVKHRIRARTP